MAEATDAIQAAFDLVLRRKALGAEAAAMQRTAILSDRYRHLAPQLEPRGARTHPPRRATPPKTD
jgi:hypothetical protein